MTKRTVKRKPRSPKRAAKPVEKTAAECTCFTANGKREHDLFTKEKPHDASALAMLGAVCCPWETPENILGGTLEQLARELDALACSDFTDADSEDLKALLTGMAERARVAIEVDSRINRVSDAERWANAGVPS